MKVTDLHPDSKLWLYQTNRALSPTEIQWLDEQLAQFAIDWASHGKNLKAAANVLNPYFIALAVDLTQANASGCSIDASVRFIKEVGKQLEVDFFNRLKMWTETPEGTVEMIPFRLLAEVPNNYLYNPLLQTVADLNDKFKVQVASYLESI